MHISSLPNEYGIGSLGKEAFDFANSLHESGQRYWQLLPLGPTGFGDSPYQTFSAFAGNPYFIDIQTLVDDGLLTQSEVEPHRCEPCDTVDYGKLFETRGELLRQAFLRGADRFAVDLEEFCEQNSEWLEDYAVYMAIKKHFDMRPWTLWEDESIRRHEREAVENYKVQLADEIEFQKFLQFLFFMQWNRFKRYANDKGVYFIGDMPIYVSLDSSDVWANGEQFLLGDDGRPQWVAGVPPDYFTADGQLWGNPLYDWQRMKNDGYWWWLRRIRLTSRMFDVLRIDHFRGIESYWRVPAADKTARGGEWVKGPGMDLINAIKAQFSDIEIIAEDLGYLTKEVYELVEESGFPGMKVLQFAFDSRETSNYLPHTYPRHCVCYTGTHDNTTACGWFKEAKESDVATAIKYLGLNEQEGYNWGMIRGGMSSVADLFVAQMQDYLALSGSNRMNTPGTLGNWRWRMLPGAFDEELAAKIRDYTRMYDRLAD